MKMKHPAKAAHFLQMMQDQKNNSRKSRTITWMISSNTEMRSAGMMNKHLNAV